MPYKTVTDLPPTVQKVLPKHGQEIYLAVFNQAWGKHHNEENREEICHRIAWSAVKRIYVKEEGRWVSKGNH